MSSLQFALSLLSVSAKGVKRGEDGNLKQTLFLGVLVLEEKLPMGRVVTDVYAVRLCENMGGLFSNDFSVHLPKQPRKQKENN